MSKLRGVRCEKCGKEVSILVSETGAMAIAMLAMAKRDHARVCPGRVVEFQR